MELLVVIAITAILMGIMFVPLGRAIDMSARARATIDGQDSVRGAMRQVVRDLSQAMEVYDPLDLSLLGFNQWTTVGNRPRPAAGAVPEEYRVRNGLLVLRLPRRQYFCQEFDHYVTQGDIDTAYGLGTPYDWVAIDACPRHPGSRLDMRPTQPIQPDTRLTAYFIGLKNPSVPRYDNLLLFRTGTQSALNTYTLYRATFELHATTPGQPDANGNGLDDRYETILTDPGFFYDTTPVSAVVAGQARSKPRYEWWLDVSRSVLNSETADVVRWLEVNGKYLPHSLCTFGPSPADGEIAQPNREVSRHLLGSVGPAELPPVEYSVKHGHWITDPQAVGDGSTPIPAGLLVTHTPEPGQFLGPRIQIIDRSSGTTVFDSSVAGLRQRMVAYDSKTGRIVTAFPRRNPDPNLPLILQEYALLPPPDPAALTAQLSSDASTVNGMPASYGSAVASFGALARIVPGSETVILAEMSNPGSPAVQPLRRAFWTGLPIVNRRDPNNYPTRALERDEYAIDYGTGTITLSDAHDWTSESRKLLAKYLFQTNTNNDVVRVSYTTREMLLANLGLVQYTRRRGESLPFEVSERVVVRNLKR